MSALSRWAGSSCGFPAVEAFMAAAARASWLLVVNLASKKGSFRNGPDFKVESISLNFEMGDVGSMFADSETPV
jgi:hypothetical protein